MKHLKWFERLTTMFYKRRRYVCTCWKLFSEKNPFVERYQRFSKEANQVMRIRSVKATTFKEAAETIGTSSSTVIRCFKTLVQELPSGVKLPRAIAIDEYKADTDAGKYQKKALIIRRKSSSTMHMVLGNMSILKRRYY